MMAFVTVNYGDNHHELFNPNCKTRLFMENIKKRCDCPQEMEIELADEYGNLKNINSLPSRYANQVLTTDRELLVLIQVKRNKTDDSLTSLELDDVTYEPLLNNSDIINTRFKARLANRDPDSGRPQSRTKRSSREKREKATRRSTEITSSEKQEELNSSSNSRRNGSSRVKTSNRSKSKGKSK